MQASTDQVVVPLFLAMIAAHAFLVKHAHKPDMC